MKRTEKRRRKIFLAIPLIFVMVSLVQPDGTVEAAEKEPFEEATDDWETMLERLDQAIRNAKGENVNYFAGNRFEVPQEILKKLAGQKATLGLHTSNGVTFSVSVQDVKETDEPVRMEVCYEPVLSEEVLGQLNGYPIVKQFYMTEPLKYPCRVNVHMALGEENFGNLAKLYFYDDGSGKLCLEDSYRITEDGHAVFGLNRGDEYVVAIEGYQVAAGDTLSRIAARHHLDLKVLKAANPQIQNADLIRPGQIINIPNP